MMPSAGRDSGDVGIVFLPAKSPFNASSKLPSDFFIAFLNFAFSLAFFCSRRGSESGRYGESTVCGSGVGLFKLSSSLSSPKSTMNGSQRHCCQRA